MWGWGGGTRKGKMAQAGMMQGMMPGMFPGMMPPMPKLSPQCIACFNQYDKDKWDNKCKKLDIILEKNVYY